MTVIPVIDLLQGQVVLARQGQRHDYRPIDSPLCRHGAVLPLVQTLCERFASSHLYIADLDAIQGRGDHAALIAQIAERHPALELWVDAGFSQPAAIASARAAVRLRPVVGSESWQHAGPLPDPDCILSIDRDAHGLRDPSGVAADRAHYPPDVILMNLARVGATEGPDIALLEQARADTPGHRLYLAGGIRDADDLRAVQAAGAAGVLLASALHQGRISATDLSRFS